MFDFIDGYIATVKEELNKHHGVKIHACEFYNGKYMRVFYERYNSGTVDADKALNPAKASVPAAKPTPAPKVVK
jgi:hypothetical protein